MKELFNHYGSTVVAAVVALAILVSLGGFQMAVSLGTILKPTLQEVQTDPSEALYSFAENAGISVTFSGNTITSGHSVSLSQYFSATDRKGNPVPLFVSKVQDEKGSLVTYQEGLGTQKITFETEGIYSLWLTGADANGTKQEIFVKIPVQKGA